MEKLAPVTLDAPSFVDYQQVSPETEKAPNLLTQRCDSCGDSVIIDAGDVIYGGRWYHAKCWLVAREELTTDHIERKGG